MTPALRVALLLSLLAGCRSAEPAVGAPPPPAAPEEVPAPPPLPEPTGHLQVCGILDEDKPDYTFNSAKLEDFPLDERGLVSHLPGPFTMALLDREGRVLSSEQFGMMWGHGARIGPDGKMDCHPVAVPFSCLNLPFVPGAERLEVRRDGVVLEQYTRTPTAPELRITAPLAGTRRPAKGSIEIVWEASDADGDQLAHTIYYRPGPGDGGLGQWQAVIGDFRDTRMELDASLLPPGPAPELMVLTTDRFNTTRAVVPLAASH